MIVIDNDVPLITGESATNRNPRLGWHSLVTRGNVSADSQAADHPVSELGNPATNLKWVSSSSSTQYVTADFGSAQTYDYVGIAGHNFGSDGITFRLESSENGSDWTQIFANESPVSDKPIIVHFDAVSSRYVRLRMTGGTPEIAVLYIGEMLVLQRRFYVGHTPVTYGRTTSVANGVSESGQFLGQIVRREMKRSSIALQNLSPDWYRDNLEAFAEVARVTPFFFAWRPSAYPNETGYAWATSDPDVSNQRSNGMMQWSLEFQAHA